MELSSQITGNSVSKRFPSCMRKTTHVVKLILMVMKSLILESDIYVFGVIRALSCGKTQAEIPMNAIFTHTSLCILN